MRGRSLSEWKRLFTRSQKNLKRVITRLADADKTWHLIQELEAKLQERPSDFVQHQLDIARRKITRILARRIT